ncbi:peptidyl-tRNA hydrolase [Candidatus Woesearchaeota archaeon]|nr:MAG: peptidyl-tRNA hydrolase [Candidatus Woesearchaeota archaeon]
MYKQVILVRADLRLPKGKTAAQAAHAAVDAALKADKVALRAWRSEGMAKIVVKVSNDEELYRYIQAGKDANLPTSIITDAGKTVVAPGTVTCGAIGPAKEDLIDPITEKLKLL